MTTFWNWLSRLDPFPVALWVLVLALIFFFGALAVALGRFARAMGQMEGRFDGLLRELSLTALRIREAAERHALRQAQGVVSSSNHANPAAGPVVISGNPGLAVASGSLNPGEEHELAAAADPNGTVGLPEPVTGDPPPSDHREPQVEC